MIQKSKDTFKKIMSNKYRKIAFILIFDLIFAAVAYTVARFVFFASDELWDVYFRVRIDNFLDNEIWIAVVFIVFTILSLITLDNYNAVWRYAGRVEFFKIILAFIVNIALLFIFSVVMRYAFQIMIPAPLILIFIFFDVILVTVSRYSQSIRNYIVHLRNRVGEKVGLDNKTTVLRTIIIGAGYTGNMFIGRAFNNPDEGHVPVALIDEDPEKQQKKIHGIKVEGGMDKLSTVVKKYRAEAIVIAIVNLSKSRLKELYAECRKYNLPIKLMGSLKDAESGTLVPTLELRDIKVEELLGREEFKTQQGLLELAVKNQVVLVTGGAGSIGSELCRQSLSVGCKKLIVMDIHENGCFEFNEELKAAYECDRYAMVVGSVRDANRLDEVFAKYKPDVVFHAAAYKHVPIMELAATEAIKNNVFGTRNVIEAAEKYGAKRFIFISTDKAVNPANIMGASKRIAEMVVQDRGKASSMQMAAVRFGNVLGSNGSVIPIFLRQIKQGGPITLTHQDITRYFMTIPEAVRLVMQAGALARNGDVFVLDMGEPVKIYDLACDLIRINGLEPEKDIAINVTGLRRGEKMFEELCYSKESVDVTTHEGIFATKMETLDSTVLAKQIQSLSDAVLLQQEENVIESIFDMVPSIYRKKNGGVD